MSKSIAAKTVSVLASLALAWAATGCAHTTRVAANGTLHVALSEYRLNPDNVHAGAGTLTIFVQNFGRLTHNLVITQDGRPAGGTKPIPPGGSATLTVYLPAGTYQMASTILSDEDLGAYGTLKVS